MVRTILMVGFPLLLVLLAVVAWRVIGATLRPVEALRAGAEEITGGARPGQLPVPASRDEIHRLAVTLNGMLDRLESARVRQRAFVADAAHELRSPLANMRTQLEVAQHLGARTDWPAVADDLLTDTKRLSRLVDDLLLLARADDGTPRPRRSSGPVDLVALVGGVVQRYPAPPVRFEPPDGPVWVQGEPDALDRVLANLLDNAVRHAVGEVVVAVLPQRRDGADGHLVTVTDDGPGIPVADRDRVFDRFTRLDDARTRDDGGAGLGLAIVRELVRRQGGTIHLADAPADPLRLADVPAGTVRLADAPADSIDPVDAHADSIRLADVPAGTVRLADAPAGSGGPGPGPGPGLRVEVRLPAVGGPAD
jgi:signal transduction histidine kinase